MHWRKKDEAGQGVRYPHRKQTNLLFLDSHAGSFPDLGLGGPNLNSDFYGIYFYSAEEYANWE